MNPSESDRTATPARRLIESLDQAIDAFDMDPNDKELASVLREAANVASDDEMFCDRVKRLAKRAASAETPSERDITSVMARDVRSYLMCQYSRQSQSRNLCTSKLEPTKKLQ